MIYPNTQPSGIVGGGDDNRKRLQQMLSKLGAAPLFGSSGKSASVQSLPSVGAPALSFNPFLKMLAGRPGETFQQLPQGISGALAAGVQNGPTNGYLGSSIPTTGGQGASAPAPASLGVPSSQPSQQQSDPFAGNNGFGGFNDSIAGAHPASGGAPLSPQQGGLGVGINNPLYHTLLQLAMYGQDR